MCIRDRDEEKKGGLFGFFQKKRNELEAMKASYAKAEVNVDKIVRVLENQQVVLMKDIAMPVSYTHLFRWAKRAF